MKDANNHLSLICFCNLARFSHVFLHMRTPVCFWFRQTIFCCTFFSFFLFSAFVRAEVNGKCFSEESTGEARAEPRFIEGSEKAIESRNVSRRSSLSVAERYHFYQSRCFPIPFFARA